MDQTSAASDIPTKKNKVRYFTVQTEEERLINCLLYRLFSPHCEKRHFNLLRFCVNNKIHLENNPCHPFYFGLSMEIENLLRKLECDFTMHFYCVFDLAKKVLLIQCRGRIRIIYDGE